jgi:hypothetical protein
MELTDREMDVHTANRRTGIPMESIVSTFTIERDRQRKYINCIKAILLDEK